MKINKTVAWVLAGVSILVVLIMVPVVSYISNYNYGNRAENVIVAEYKNMENILAQYSLKVSEAVQVNDMYKDDLKDVISTALKSRYGAEGSKAMFQWIKEHDVNLDASVYKKIQQMIEAGRNKFENAQTKFIDTKRVYETNLGYLWKGFWLSAAGYPKINLDNYKIITSGHAQETFETGIDQGLKLR